MVFLREDMRFTHSLKLNPSDWGLCFSQLWNGAVRLSLAGIKEILILHDTLNFKSLIFLMVLMLVKAYVEKGNIKLTHSSFLNGMNYKEAIQKLS